MKQRFPAFLLGCFLSVTGLYAQLCSPNMSYTQSGIYPDTATNFAPGCLGQFYLQDFTLVVPDDTVIFGFNFTITFMRIDSIGGLPAGMTYSCNPGTCTYPGNSHGCAQVYGTPPAVGTFPLIIYVTLQGTNPIFGTQTIHPTYVGYRLRIGAYAALTTGSVNATCGNSNGIAWVTATGPVAYTYQWNSSPVSTNDTIVNQPAGAYQVIVSDNVGCSVSSTVTIANTGAPTVDSLVFSSVSCNGGNDGDAHVYVSGGTPGYTYSWTSGATTPVATGLTAGTYTVTITDQNNCQLTSFTTITEPTALSISLSQTDVSCSGGADGTALATVTGGYAPYTYLWSNGDTNPGANGLPAGAYYVIVTDSRNCVSTSTTVNITEPPALVLSMGSTAVACPGGSNGSATVSPSGGTPSYSYSWSSGGSTNTITGQPAGTYTVTITDANNCTASSTTTISQPPAWTVNTAQQNNSCFGANDGMASVSVSGATPGYSYVWNTPGTNDTIYNLSPGTYTVTITDANSCTQTATVTITQPQALSLSLTGTDETVSGASDGAVSTSISGGISPYTFSWSNSATTQNLSNIPGGMYILTATDNNGCTITDTITIVTLSGSGIPELPGSWKVYPNPATHEIIIDAGSYNESYALDIYNLSGKNMLHRDALTGKSLVAIDGMVAGAYILVVRTAGGVYRYRFIKQ